MPWSFGPTGSAPRFRRDECTPEYPASRLAERLQHRNATDAALNRDDSRFGRPNRCFRREK